MKIYSVWGYLTIGAYLAVSAIAAPPHLGPWLGTLVASAYFVACWFVGGVYLADVMHLGISHRALDFEEWFVKGVTLLNNTFFVYVGPVAWVRRHRLHHAFSDHPGDPNKLASDGFWRTAWLCLFPYPCQDDLANDEILKSWTFRLVESPLFCVLAQTFNFLLLWLLVRDLRFAAAMWLGFRVFCLWINMVQNFWTHDRRFGTRRYDSTDHSMNIGEFLPVTITFSACLQNNHHQHPNVLRLSHSDSEYDFGFLTVKWMKALGLVKPSRSGDKIPPDVPLQALDF